MFSGLALDVGRQLLYFTDEAQGHVTQLELNYSRSVDDVTTRSRIIDSTAGSRPKSIAIDTVNRLRKQCILIPL